MRAIRFLVVFCFLLCGCSGVDYLKKEQLPYNYDIAKPYREIGLKQSSSAEVLAQLRAGPGSSRLISHSKDIYALLGEGKEGYKNWFTMVAFKGGISKTDKTRLWHTEQDAMVYRKYLAIIDEKPKSSSMFASGKPGVHFDCELVLGIQVVFKPYSNINVKRIALLRAVLADFQSDMDRMGGYNRQLESNGLLISQSLEGVLVKLDNFPSLASRLVEPGGLEFDHVNLDKGRISMSIESDIVRVSMRLGSFLDQLEIKPPKQIQEAQEETATEG